MDPPQFGSYFAFPDPWFLLLFFSALFEEMVFRGLLQRRLIQRYGIYRGIFLVGIVWAAFHFVSDVSFSRLTETDVLLKLSWRILFCLALSYVALFRFWPVRNESEPEAAPAVANPEPAV